MAATADVSSQLTIFAKTASTEPTAAPELDAALVFEQHFDFVWCSMRRLGVPASALDDAVQDVFVVVHRRIGDFEGLSTVTTWLFGIVLKVAAAYRRSEKRRDRVIDARAPSADLTASQMRDPTDNLARSQAARTLQRVLDAMDSDKRAIFVGVEIEELTVPEIAEALGLNVNTAYARLRSARLMFEAALAKLKKQETR